MATVEQQIIAEGTLRAALLRALDRASDKQDDQDKYNRDQQNEWRKSLEDLGNKMATKDDWRALDARLSKNEATVNGLPRNHMPLTFVRLS